MIKCPNCGEIHSDDKKFCKYCGKPLKRPSRWKKRLIVGIIIFIIVVILGFYLMSGLTESDNEYSNLDSTFYSNNDDAIDEIIKSPSEEVKFKRVDFNYLFNMYVYEDSNYYEATPQFNATYEWDDSVHWGSGFSSIYYYDQYDDINQLISLFKSNYPKMTYSIDGNLFIFTNTDTYSYVGVSSQDNKFVIVGGPMDIENQKTVANSIKFD